MSAPPVERIEQIRKYLHPQDGTHTCPFDLATVLNDACFLLEQLDKLHEFVHRQRVVVPHVPPELMGEMHALIDKLRAAPGAFLQQEMDSRPAAFIAREPIAENEQVILELTATGWRHVTKTEAAERKPEGYREG